MTGDPDSPADGYELTPADKAYVWHWLAYAPALPRHVYEAVRAEMRAVNEQEEARQQAESEAAEPDDDSDRTDGTGVTS